MEKVAFETLKLIPRFIRDDRNGYALAAAIDIAMQRVAQDTADIDVLLRDPDNMPEWALDEAAWASAMPWYDFAADIETKRGWVKRADEIRAMIGTRGAIRRLLLGIYDQCVIEEYWQYGGDLNHFRVAVRGTYSAQKTAWAVKAVEAVKPLRCVLDGLTLAAETVIAVTETMAIGVILKPICGTAVSGDEYGTL